MWLPFWSDLRRREVIISSTLIRNATQDGQRAFTNRRLASCSVICHPVVAESHGQWGLVLNKTMSRTTVSSGYWLGLSLQVRDGSRGEDPVSASAAEANLPHRLDGCLRPPWRTTRHSRRYFASLRVLLLLRIEWNAIMAIQVSGPYRSGRRYIRKKIK